MMTSDLLDLLKTGAWHNYWHDYPGETLVSRVLALITLVLGAVLTARFITWVTGHISRRIDASFQKSDALVRTESAKHRQAVASVISYVAIALVVIWVFVEVISILEIPISSLVAPAAVIGAALGFGAQRIVQDLLAGFFIITEKQYGFGDLVELTIAANNEALGTVEDVTLRVTKLRTSEGEMFTIPNGQIVKTLNLSKDWARAVIDIPVPSSADLTVVNDVLRQLCEAAPYDPKLRNLLLDKPQLMGVESIQVDTVNLRMVARTLPGKQFEVGRQLRLLVVATLAKAGIATNVDTTPVVAASVHPATAGGAERETQGPGNS
jgi:small conductance mechanosensitive channel